ncbi:alpha-tocopherol transfer protein-like [Zophobas morio]|uniref:alpha-tocopherol transfer protein-like n=1 Tax=Zophobas morio TaxID=2755281 RepID=UPI003083EA8A
MSVHCINFPEFVSRIQGIFKMVLRPKIYDKLKIDSDLESLYQVIPKECLPSEYGGSCSSIQSLLKKWDEVLQTHRDFFLENYKNVSLEHL